jgi:peptidoglycan/xylan/chitin deacetylase (PgdA/CDA1 family)
MATPPGSNGRVPVGDPAPGGVGAIVREGVRAGVRVLSIAGDRVAPPPRGITVLIYHQVGGPRPGVVNLPVALFRRQMEALAASGRVLSLDDAIAALNDDHERSWEPGDNPVVVTFDDGTADFATHAVPVLAEFGVPATLYVATRWIDEGLAFWDDGPALSWAALAEAKATGLITFASHTHGHLLADRSDPGVFASDIDRSLELLGEHLGVTATHFAYPKALAPSPAVDTVVRERFASAALAGCRANPVGTDPYRLARSPLQVGDAMKGFWRKANGGMRLEDTVRASIGKVRSRVGRRRRG